MNLPPAFVLAIVMLGSVPAGFAAAFAARRLADSNHPHPAVTIGACAVLGQWAAVVMPPGPLLAVTCALGWTLLVLASVDALAFRLPDLLTLPLIAAGLGVSFLLPDRDTVGHLAGALAGALCFYAIAAGYRFARGREGLGLGDTKLAAAAGAWLDWQALPFVVLVACFVGLLWVGIAATRRGTEGLNERIPFGVALSFAIWVVWLHGLPGFLD